MSDVNQMTYHLNMAMYSHLFLTRGSIQPNSHSFNPQQSMSTLGYGKTMPAVSNNLSPLQNQVYSVLKELDNGMNMDGVKLHDVAFKMRGVASESDVRSCLDILMNESMIYSTVDDETFKLS